MAIITHNESKVYVLLFPFPQSKPFPNMFTQPKIHKNSICMKFHNTAHQGIILTQSTHHKIYYIQSEKKEI